MTTPARRRLMRDFKVLQKDPPIKIFKNIQNPYKCKFTVFRTVFEHFLREYKEHRAITTS